MQLKQKGFFLYPQDNSQQQFVPMVDSGPPINTMEQINELLIKPDWGKSNIHVPVPNLKEKEFFVLAKDENGKPIVLMDANKRVYEKTSFLFQDEEKPWIQQSIPVPEDEIFNTSFVTSVSDPQDRAALASLCDSYYFGIVCQAIIKENMAYDLYHTKQNIGSIVHINKSKDGETLRMVKTTITKGESIANWVMRQQADQENQRRMFGFLPKMGNK